MDFERPVGAGVTVGGQKSVDPALGYFYTHKLQLAVVAVKEQSNNRAVISGVRREQQRSADR